MNDIGGVKRRHANENIDPQKAKILRVKHKLQFD